MNETAEYSGQFKNEAAIVRKYVEKLSAITGQEVEVRGILKRDENGTPSKAWRILIKPESGETVNKVAIADWDDTLVPYSERKEKLYEYLTELIPKESGVEKELFTKTCKAINKAARILPENGVHPEHYSPRMELMALTSVLNELKAGGGSRLMDQITTESGNAEDENAARNYITTEILPSLKGFADIRQEAEKGNGKDYFIELVNQSVSLDPEEELPNRVDPEIWKVYKETMLKSNIPENEFGNFDLSDNVRFIVATFGEASFQLEKITNSIKKLKKHGSRIPDELLIFLRGRKNPIIKYIAEVYKDANITYMDDSPRQVEKVSKIEGINTILAKREGAKRSKEEAAKYIKTVNIADHKLSEIIN